MNVDTSVSLSYPESLRRFYQRAGNVSFLKNITDGLKEDNSFKTAEICLSVGTGCGLADIEVIKRCLPCLKKLIVVDKDADGIRELKVNLKVAFADNLQVEYHEMTIEKFMENMTDWKYSKEVDVVMCIHSIYFMSRSDRMNLFKRCFDTWLKPTGVLVVVTGTKEHSIVKLQEELRPYVELAAHSEVMRDELKVLKLDITREILYEHALDLREYDHDLYELFKTSYKVPITEEMVERGVRAVAPDGWGQISGIAFIIKGNTCL